MATIGVEGVEIVIYKADQYITTLITDVEGRASTMLEADAYRAEFWYEGRKIGEYTFTLEVDSYVFWAFPAILMAVIKKLPIEVEVVEVKLGDVVKSLPLITEVEAKLGDVVVEDSLVAECTIPPQAFPTVSLAQTVDVKLGDVTASQTLTETVTAV